MLPIQAALLFILVNFAWGDPTPPGNGGCGDIMRNENLNHEFPGIVAHGIHSLTLNTIRHFFNPFAGEDNGIPVVNVNLTQNNPILPNAPLIALDNRFTLPAQWALDHILRHMDDENYGPKNSNPLDSMAHALHMQEVWTKTAGYYQDIKESPPTTPGFCACAEDTTSANIGYVSINQSLQYLAKKIRTPELMYKSIDDKGKNTEKGKGKLKGKGSGRGKGKGKGKGKAKGKGKKNNGNKKRPVYYLDTGSLGKSPVYYLDTGSLGKPSVYYADTGSLGETPTYYADTGNLGIPPSVGNIEKETSLPHIVNEETWNIIKNAMVYHGDKLEDILYQLALFLYCKLE